MAGQERGGGGSNNPGTPTTTGGGTTTPPPPAWKLPNYKAGTYGAFAVALLHTLGVKAPTQGQMDFLLSWMNKESGQGANNPLGIHGGAVNIGSFNLGVEETAGYLRMSAYKGILASITSKNATYDQRFNTAARTGFYTWSGHGYEYFGQATNMNTAGSDTLGTRSPGGGTQSGGGTGGGGSITLPDGTVISSPSTTTVTAKDFLAHMQQSGIAINSASISFARYAAAQGLSWSVAEYTMMHEPWFQSQFPGLFDAQGHLRYSPAQYNAEYARYKGIASQTGATLTRDQFGYALGKNIDATTFGNRMQAIQFVESNKQDMEQFEQTLKARGLLKGDLKKSDMYHLAMGDAPPVWNKVWEEGYLRASAANAGLVVGRDMNRKMILNLIKEHPELYNTIQSGGSEAIQQKWYQLAQDLKTTAPASRLYGMGLTASDLAQLEFGGPKAADIAQKAQQALANLKAAGNQEAGTPLGALAARAGQSQTSTALSSGVQSPFETP